MDREEDILMIQYADHDSENDTTLPRMVRWNENGFAIPIFDEPNSSNDQTGTCLNFAFNFSLLLLLSLNIIFQLQLLTHGWYLVTAVNLVLHQ